MARYRKLDPRFWSDEAVRRLSPVEKLLAIYAFSAQSNRIGFFSFSPARAAEDLELPPKTFAKGFHKVLETLHWRWDETARVLYIPTWWKYNTPENPNVLKFCLKDAHEVPQTQLFIEFLANLKYLPETFHETFQKGLSSCSQQPSPNQEQDQEQEKEQNQEQDCLGGVAQPLNTNGNGNGHHAAAEEPSERLTPEDLIEAWNEHVAPLGLPRVTELTKSRRSKVLARLEEHPTPTFWQTVLGNIEDSPFLRGLVPPKNGEKPWRANFDWLFKNDTNIVSVFEGKYE